MECGRKAACSAEQHIDCEEQGANGGELSLHVVPGSRHDEYDSGEDGTDNGAYWKELFEPRDHAVSEGLVVVDALRGC